MSEPSPDTFAAAIALIGLAVDPEATSARLAELQKGVEALARHRPSSMPTVRRATRQNAFERRLVDISEGSNHRDTPNEFWDQTSRLRLWSPRSGRSPHSGSVGRENA
jgi:hypothetical protein